MIFGTDLVNSPAQKQGRRHQHVSRRPLLATIRASVLPHWTDHWSEIVEGAQHGRTLHLGSGFKPIPGALTVDINEGTGPDVVCSLNDIPWPFPQSSFDSLVAISIVEHLDDFLGVAREIHRVLKPGGSAYILVPHFSSAATHVDPTHKQQLSARSCDYFIVGTTISKEFGFYVPFRFELVRRYVHLQGALRYIPGAEWVARRYPAFWEEYLCFVLRGGGIFWHLRAVK
jgi:SAM-dependent methyltransferase